jgi:ribose/xylose/arabinose/galactoside ABC-type transport system permease subunit
MLPNTMTAADQSVRARFGQTDWVSGRTLGLIMFAGVLMVVMSLVSPSFLTSATFFSQSRYIALYVLIAMSQAICLAVGDMNLAVGGGQPCHGRAGLARWRRTTRRCRRGSPCRWYLFGPLTGLLHGLAITRLKIDAFIVTLSMMFVYMGLHRESPAATPTPFRVRSGGWGRADSAGCRTWW